MRRRTQRERAEAWARSCVYLDRGVVLSVGDGRATVLGGGVHAFSDEAVESVRRVLVETWLYARQAKGGVR